MPLRPLSRDQAWILPPNLDELVAQDHTARFVAALMARRAALPPTTRACC